MRWGGTSEWASARHVIGWTVAVCLVLTASSPTYAITIVTYNVLNYDGIGSCDLEREASYRTVLRAIDLEGDVDLLCVQEIEGNLTGANNFCDRVLNHPDGPGSNPGGAFTTVFVNGVGDGIGGDPPGGDNAMYYRAGKVTVLQSLTIQTESAGGIRDWTYHQARLAGYASTAAELHIFIAHLSSGGGASQRQIEAQVYRNWVEANLAAGANIICCGDFNLENSTEGAWTIFTQSQGANRGRLRDPVDRVGNWSSSSFADVHTQSPYIASAPSCASGCGYSGGGMDDRFDFLLTSDPLHDGSTMDYIAGSYRTYGNDGLHWDKGINEPPAIPEGQTIADALACASDHLPVVMEVIAPPLLPAISPISFGSVLVGGTAERTLVVQNAAPVPGLTLRYVLGIPSGFTGPPPQLFDEPAGGGGNSHVLAMLTATSGSKVGTLVINNNSPDAPARNVTLFGQVLKHAVPSLQAGAEVTSEAMDFGTHPAGVFTDGTTSIYNFGFGSLQAPLEVYALQITGNSRFGVPAFTPTVVTSTPAQFTIHFDSAGAPLGLYDAVLTFSTRDDQTLPGAIELSPLTINLSAVVGILGDFDGDGVNGNDIPAFVSVLLDPASATSYQQYIADLNGDGLNDGRDVQPFVEALLP